MLIRVPSGSRIKLDAVGDAAAAVFGLRRVEFGVVGLPVELQDGAVNVQPIGSAQTTLYARMRWQKMCRDQGLPKSKGIDISIESGAVGGEDVAVVLVCTAKPRREIVVFSKGIAFPLGSLDEAIRRGVRRTTAGMVIHEKMPNVPADDWQRHFPPWTPRRRQISYAVRDALSQLSP